jgi:hypothetical protein
MGVVRGEVVVSGGEKRPTKKRGTICPRLERQWTKRGAEGRDGNDGRKKSSAPRT